MPLPDPAAYYGAEDAARAQLLQNVPTDDATLAQLLGIDPTDPRLQQARQYLNAGASLDTARYFINAAPPVDTSGQAVGADGSPIGNYTNDQLAQLTQNLPAGSGYLTDAQYQDALERHYSFQDDAMRRLGIVGGLALLGGGLAGGFGAGAGSTSGGAASTFPLATGGTVTATPIATGAGTVAGTTAGAGAAGAGGAATAAVPTAAGAASNFLSKYGDYILPAVNAVGSVVAADRATDAETAALDRAIAEEARQFDLTRADWAPWMDTGRDALSNLNDPQTNFLASPNYEFVRGEGVRDIGNTFSARGAGQSGNALRALAEFNSNLARGEFGDWYNRELARAGLGTTGTSAVTNARQNATGATSNYLTKQGVSRASGVLGKYGALANAGQDIYENFLYRRRNRQAA